MGTSILRSHDCLQGRFRNDALALATSRVRSRRNSTKPNHNFHCYAYHHRRWRRSTVASNHLDRDRSAKGPSTRNVGMGQVKRGEKLILENSHKSGLAVTEDQKQIRVSDPKEGMYAGSAFVTSPPPCFVPVPGFLGRNDAATSDLRRLLRLDQRIR